MHRWFLPILSLVVGGAYVIVGAVRLPANLKAVSDAAHTPEQSGWLIAVGLGIAIVSFIFARFIAGMAKEKVWDLLHGGAGAAVSAALIGMMLALAHFLASKTIGNAGLLKYLPVIFSVYAIAAGAEAFLNFVLNLYRPRKKGEYLRPAFDSRVLAFAAAIASPTPSPTRSTTSSATTFRAPGSTALSLGPLLRSRFWAWACSGCCPRSPWFSRMNAACCSNAANWSARRGPGS